MQRLHHMANIIVLTRDRGSGRVTVDRDGSPVLRYDLHPYDARHLMIGLQEALRVHKAAGAEEVSAPHNRRLAFRSGKDNNFEHFLKEVEERGFQPNAYALFSAHQMSSCRIGGNTALGAVDPTGETYEVRNLFVADGSVLPTASGVNPMVTIMGTAHFLAQHIKSKL
jgi:choline dehydrogenase-like flavoprotein